MALCFRFSKLLILALAVVEYTPAPGARSFGELSFADAEAQGEANLRTER